jgi:hypothetical protein
MRLSMSALSPENPSIFATATLRRINDQRAGLQGDAGEAAGDYGDFLAVVEAVGAEIDMAARHALRGGIVGWNNREGNDWLSDVIARFGHDALAEGFDFRAGGAGAHQHAVASRFANTFYDEFWEVG